VRLSPLCITAFPKVLSMPQTLKSQCLIIFLIYFLFFYSKVFVSAKNSQKPVPYYIFTA
jgi:hypothetical protein